MLSSSNNSSHHEGLLFPNKSNHNSSIDDQRTEYVRHVSDDDLDFPAFKPSDDKNLENYNKGHIMSATRAQSNVDGLAHVSQSSVAK